MVPGVFANDPPGPVRMIRFDDDTGRANIDERSVGNSVFGEGGFGQQRVTVAEGGDSDQVIIEPELLSHHRLNDCLNERLWRGDVVGNAATESGSEQ